MKTLHNIYINVIWTLYDDHNEVDLMFETTTIAACEVVGFNATKYNP